MDEVGAATKNEHTSDPSKGYVPVVAFLDPNREEPLRCSAGVAQEPHRTRTEPLLTSW